MEIKELRTVKGLGTAILVLSIIALIFSVILCLMAESIAKLYVDAATGTSTLNSFGITSDAVIATSADDAVTVYKTGLVFAGVWGIVCAAFALVCGVIARKVVDEPTTIGKARNWGIVCIVISVLGQSLITLILSIILVVKACSAKKKLAASAEYGTY